MSTAVHNAITALCHPNRASADFLISSPLLDEPGAAEETAGDGHPLRGD
jgi:hypothetical protein